MEDIKFSVVIPAYNAENFIVQCLEYVRLQSYKNFEVLVTNNGSTDGTLLLLEKYKEAYPDLALTITTQQNLGISGSRNTGIDKAQGQYICFIDADDCWYPDKLTRVAWYIKQYPEADIFCHNQAFRSENGLSVSKCRILKEPVYEDLLFNGNGLFGSAMTVRTDKLREVNGFDMQYTGGQEDYDCWMRLARNGAKFQSIPELLGENLVRLNSESANIEKHELAVFQLRVEHLKFLQNAKNYTEEWFNHYKIVFEQKMFYGMGRRYQHNGEWSKAKAALKRSILQDLFFWKAYAVYFFCLLKYKK